MVSSFLIFLVRERECKAKHVQFVSGVDPWSYWLSTYLWDLLNYALPAIGCLILFFAFSVDEYVGAASLGYTILIFFLCVCLLVCDLHYPP